MDDVVLKKKAEINSLVQKFCDNRLNEEYWFLCEKIISKLSRKRNVPFLSGKIEIWAAGVVWCIARINFLFDKANKYFLTSEDICNYFGVNKSTAGQKATLIEKTLKIRLFDENFCTKEMQYENPFRSIAMANGLIIPKDIIED